jgi:carbonic anhydrase
VKKLIQGIIDFRRNIRPGYRETFARLALGQKPDSLFIACSDSRVVPNLFASTNPGDLFVIRNVGNLIPSCGTQGVSESDESEGAAIEFALLNLKVKDVIVCGHSECGAMMAISNGREKIQSLHLRNWLRHGEAALSQDKNHWNISADLAPHNRLSQLNVLQQIEHLHSYPLVRERIDAGTLSIHAWWFDIANADVYLYDFEKRRFAIIDEKNAEKLIQKEKTFQSASTHTDDCICS